MADVKNLTTAPESGNEGCTCGNCIDGWFSPRMKERLEGEVDFLRFVSNTILEEDLTDLGPNELIPDWCIFGDTSLHYIPTEFQQKMTLSFYKAYMRVIEAIHLILLQDTADASCIPTHSAIESQLGLANAETQPFFDAGGEIMFALEALVDRAYEKSPEGPEYGRKAELREEEEEFENETMELPRCRNDLDFKLVRTRLGLPPQGKGPCWFFLTDDEDSEEEEEGEYEAVNPGNQAESASAGIIN
ncbi:hypothetical protein BDY19DRAFT_992048 [Irpex rosettiformis]|uniref:Uncharacterized protein n=1 Tax=Irpex rosettiformis TaxID=378272 RepID=A0ACB8U8D6_9APHY|nr:hypothetical protein BDY19DRAFT_992048 [Irpex rosettiformis]